MYNISPKHIVYYRIGSHSAQLVLLYLQKFQHKIFNFNFIKNKSCCSSVKASVSTFLLIICRC